MTFILNDQPHQLSDPVGKVLVDVVRERCHQIGTTVACREGDCGACTVLVGDGVNYQTLTSCIAPAGNFIGKHVVTVEGIGPPGENPIQKALIEHSGTQCGFCTPGFVISLLGFYLGGETASREQAIAAIDGNICRCTGYKAIERAVEALIEKQGSIPQADRISHLVKRGLLPDYFLQISDRLRALSKPAKGKGKAVGGGTDLFVQAPDEHHHDELHLTRHQDELMGIRSENGRTYIGGATSIHDLAPLLPANFIKRFASSQIRRQASAAGNVVNASPIGDLTSWLLALDATLHLAGPEGERMVPLSDFYLGYKQIDRVEGDVVREISFAETNENQRVNFEKVSRRTHLDIASVNSSIRIEVVDEQIKSVTISAGGVAATPLQLDKTAKLLTGEPLTADLVRQAQKVAQEEIAPISDVRGSEAYKRLLLRQLLAAHFLECFPNRFKLQELI